MRRFLFTLLAISILSGASAQVKKCGIDTKALVAEEIREGATGINMLAKMVPNFDRSRLEKAGMVIGAQAGQIITLRVPVEALDELESNKEVLQYSISHRIAQPECNNTRFDTRTDSVQKGLGLDIDSAFGGEGVYIGITDWGFDYTHPNYNGGTRENRRVDMAWDHFRLAGPAPEGFDYGTVLAGADLRNAHSDTSNLYGYGTHGTHVAGICAGRGVNGIQAGQAPNARLLLCSFGLGEKEWMDGVAWMRQVAQDSNRRLVVNSSWGMYSFSTLDGTSLLCQAIDAWSNEDTVFCTSGGNNGDASFHICKTFQPGTPDTLRSVASWFWSSEGTGQVLIMWGEEGHDFSTSFRMRIEDELYSIPFINTADGDAIIEDSLLVNDKYIGYRAIVEHANPFDNRPHVQLEVNMDKNMELQLLVTATDGTVHCWNVANKKNHAGNEGCAFEGGNREGFTGGDDYYGVGEPACAAKCISVAAHSADRIGLDGVSYQYGNLADFSSYGPLINGVNKPEISAPGVDVVSSISYWTTGSYTEYLHKTVGDRIYIWSTMSGTSMSSPAVTGVVALLLQANPNITVDQIRDIIFTTARNDAITGPLVASDSMSVRWGWGKIDALKAINRALALVDIEQVETLRTPIKVYPNPANDQVRVLTNCGEAQTVDIYSVDGRLVLQTPVTIETTIDVSNWTPGIYIVRAGSRTAKLIKK